MRVVVSALVGGREQGREPAGVRLRCRQHEKRDFRRQRVVLGREEKVILAVEAEEGGLIGSEINRSSSRQRLKERAPAFRQTDEAIDAAEFRSRCAEEYRLAAAGRDALPRNANGKLDRAALKREAEA